MVGRRQWDVRVEDIGLRKGLTTHLDGKEQRESDGTEVCCSKRESRPRKKVLRVLDWAHQNGP